MKGKKGFIKYILYQILKKQHRLNTDKNRFYRKVG